VPVVARVTLTIRTFKKVSKFLLRGKGGLGLDKLGRYETHAPNLAARRTRAQRAQSRRAVRRLRRG
jgi:hypothetical protein